MRQGEVQDVVNAGVESRKRVLGRRLQRVGVGGILGVLIAMALIGFLPVVASWTLLLVAMTSGISVLVMDLVLERKRGGQGQGFPIEPRPPVERPVIEPRVIEPRPAIEPRPLEPRPPVERPPIEPRPAIEPRPQIEPRPYEPRPCHEGPLVVEPKLWDGESTSVEKSKEAAGRHA